MLLRFLLAVSATAANLAQNRVPFGSSERWNEDFVKLTDGDLLSAWRSRSRETTETRRSGIEWLALAPSKACLARAGGAVWTGDKGLMMV